MKVEMNKGRARFSPFLEKPRRNAESKQRITGADGQAEMRTARNATPSEFRSRARLSPARRRSLGRRASRRPTVTPPDSAHALDHSRHDTHACILVPHRRLCLRPY